MIAKHPYQYTQEDVLFETYAEYNQIPAAHRHGRKAARKQFSLRLAANRWSRVRWKLESKPKLTGGIHSMASELVRTDFQVGTVVKA